MDFDSFNVLLALNPFVMTLVCYTTKDILFAASLLLFAVYLSELLVPPAKQRSLITIAGKMLLWGLLMSLLRSQGLYMVACGLMIVLFQYRKSLRNRRFILVEAAQMIILLVTVLVNVVLPGMGWVKKTDSREALSVPLQQIATILKENAEAEKPFLDEELSGKALSYFEDYSLEMLDPYSADNAKSKFVTEKVIESPLRFVQTWLKLVIADMPDAISAYARMIGPYFDMRTSPYNGLIVGEVPELPEEAYGIKIKSMLPEVREAISTVISQSSSEEHCPLWLRFCDPAIVLYLIAFLLVYALVFKEKLLRSILVYPILYILTMFLGPVSLLRYSYIYLIEWPFLLGCFYTAIRTPGQKIHNK